MKFSAEYKKMNSQSYKVLGSRTTNKLFTPDNAFMFQSGLIKLNKQILSDNGQSLWVTEFQSELIRFLGLK